MKIPGKGATSRSHLRDRSTAAARRELGEPGVEVEEQVAHSNARRAVQVRHAPVRAAPGGPRRCSGIDRRVSGVIRGAVRGAAKHGSARAGERRLTLCASGLKRGAGQMRVSV